MSWLQSLTVAEIVTWIIAGGGILAGVRWLKPVMTALHHFLEDWTGEPARDGVPARPGVMAQLGMLRCDLEQVKADAKDAAFHTQSNHGSSSHDELVREIREVRGKLATVSGQILAMSREQTLQADRQAAFEVAIRHSIDDRAEIREHIGLKPNTDPEKQP